MAGVYLENFMVKIGQLYAHINEIYSQSWPDNSMTSESAVASFMIYDVFRNLASDRVWH